MKRMYVVLSVIILCSLWMLQALGQKVMGTVAQLDQKTPAQESEIQRHMQLREEMHRRLRDQLINGVGMDDDIFEGMDQMMTESFRDSFSNQATLKTDWQETNTGRTLVISPEDPAQKMDLDVKNNMITIKGEIKSETQGVTSMRSFQNSFPVPSDCDGSKVKISNKDGKILMDFPFRGSPSSPKKIPVPVQKESRIPLGPTGDEVAI